MQALSDDKVIVSRKLVRELGRREVLESVSLFDSRFGMKVWFIYHEIGQDRLVVKEWTATTLDFASIEPEEVGESSRGLKGAWVKTKSDGNWRGEKNEAKEEPLRVNNTRVTKFRTRTDYSRIEGDCNFTPTLLICLASA